MLKVDAALIRAELEKILASDEFANAGSLSRFLRFVVDQTLAGQGDQIKEYAVGVQVFGRGEAFDPRTDPIVRVQAGKLRAKLGDYYETAGLRDSLRIEIPKGAYVPVFHEAPASRRKWRPAAVAAAVLLAIGALTAWTLTRSAPDARSGLPPAAISIAVLPFANMSADMGQNYFCTGITEEITNLLSRVDGLRVTARTSASQFQGKSVDVREIGGKLGVRLVLEGSVRKSGDRFRVAAQLVNTNDGLHLWSETYDRPVNDVFAVQDEIARAITAALQVTLATGRAGAPSNRYTENVRLYELYLKGRYSLNTVTPSSADTAQSYFEQVIEKEPNFAPAWLGMAEVYLMRAGQAFASSKEMMRKTQEAVERALRIDDTLPEAHSIRGSLLSNFEWDWEGAAREFDRAIQLNPNLSRAHLGRSNLYMIQGRFAEMEESLRHAQLLDPLSSSVSQKFTQLYYYSRRTDRMIDYCRDASVAWMTLCLGNAYADSGRLAEGTELLERFYKARDPGSGFGLLIIRYVQGGRRADALRLIEEVRTLSRQRYVSSFSMAQAYVGLGDKDQAFAWLDKGFEEREMKMNTLRVEPSFDPIRSDTRFAVMLKKMRL